MSHLRRSFDLARACRRRIESELAAGARLLGADAPVVLVAREHDADMAVQLERSIRAAAVLVEPELVDAVLSRSFVVDRWPMRMDWPGALAFAAVRSALRGDPAAPALRGDPPESSAAQLAFGMVTWLESRCGNLSPDCLAPGLRLAELVAVAVGREEAAPGEAQGRAVTWQEARAAAAEGRLVTVGGFPALGLLLLRAGVLDVDAGRHRHAIAIDAGEVPQALVRGLVTAPRNPNTGRHEVRKLAAEEPGGLRYELLAPGRAVQLELPVPGGTLSGMVADAVRRVLEPEGVRHWLALLGLWSVEGGRSGVVTWTLDGHLGAMKIAPTDKHARAEARARARALVEALFALELVTYGAGGRVRGRRKLFTAWDRVEVRDGAAWTLEGARLAINPDLWHGVRHQSGEVGTNWWPAPLELAQVDHVRHPLVGSLGFLISGWFRMTAGDGWPHGVDEVLHRSARVLLQASGQAHDARRAAATWARLERELAKLVEVGVLGAWRWLGERGLDTQIELVPAGWAADRAVRGVRAYERPVREPLPGDGAGLRTWRDARGLTAPVAAAVLGVSVDTVKRAERKPEKPLGGKLAQALRDVAK